MSTLPQKPDNNTGGETILALLLAAAMYILFKAFGIM